MVPWTILLHFTLGMGLFLTAWGGGRVKASICQIVAKLCAGLALLGAGVLLTEFLSGRAFGNMDRWWFQRNMGLLSDAAGGQPSPQTCITILFFASALLVFHSTSSRRILASQLITASGLFLPLLAVLGYVFSMTPLFAGKPFFIQMALPTLFLFMVLAFGLLWLRPMRGVVGIVTSDSLSGKTARHLLSFVVLIPLVLGLDTLLCDEKGNGEPTGGGRPEYAFDHRFPDDPHASPRAANPPARRDT